MAESNIVCCFWIAFRKSERFIFKFSETFLVSGTNHWSRARLVSDMSVKVDSIILRSSMSCREKSFVRYNCWASVFHNGILRYKNFFSVLVNQFLWSQQLMLSVKFTSVSYETVLMRSLKSQFLDTKSLAINPLFTCR